MSSFSDFGDKVTKKREQNKRNSFIFYAECSNFGEARVTKSREQNKRIILFFDGVISPSFDGKVTKKLVKCKRKACFSFHFRVPYKFGVAKVTLRIATSRRPFEGGRHKLTGG